MKRARENPGWGPTWRGEMRQCLDCGRKVDSATGAEPGIEDRPKPGDFTICLRCGHLMAFADDLSFRPLTDAEILDAAGDPIILAAQAARREIYQ